MIPKTISASSLTVAMGCLARFQAENIDFIKGDGNDAARNGSSVHLALENFVREVYVEGDSKKNNLIYLLKLYESAFCEIFHRSDAAGPWYQDGLQMLRGWFPRSDYIAQGKVLMLEKKERFPLKTPVGDIPFTYIFDRIDEIGEDEYRVIDYKTIRKNVSPDDMREKVQPRVYALATQIKFPNAKRIKVEYDMIRYDRVGATFTRDENIETWKFLRAEAKKILEADPDDPPYSVNEDCRYCSLAHTCPELRKYIDAGTIYSITDPNAAADELMKLKYAAKALEKRIEQLDQIVLHHAEHEDLQAWNTEHNQVEISQSQRRGNDAERVAAIIGPELMKKYGNLTMGNVDLLLKGDDLNSDQKAQVKDCIFINYGEPTAKIKPLPPI